MMRVALMSALAMVLVAADDPKKDSELMQGRWALQSLIVNGEKTPAEVTKTGKLEVKDDKYTVQLGERTVLLTIKLDSAKKPKTIDFTSMEGDQKGKIFAGIYRIEGDTFTMCREAEPNGKRPKEFTSKADSGHILVVWKRVKK